MSLLLHVFIHIFFSLLAGYIVFLIWKKSVVSFGAAFAGGVLVDFDHFIDYFLAFGFNFKLDYFIHGYQFLQSDKIYILFHAWEYAIVLLAVVLFLKQNLKIKAFILAVSLGLFFHLGTDMVINSVSAKTYLIINRAKNNFEIQKLAYPGHWEKHLQQKAVTKLEY